DTIGGCDVDDAALPLLQHDGAEVATREKRAGEIDGDDRVPELLRERFRSGFGEALWLELVIVDEHIDAAKVRKHGIAQCGNLLGARDIALEGAGRLA